MTLRRTPCRASRPWRDGTQEHVEVELGRRPSSADEAPGAQAEQSPARWGLELQSLTPDLAAQLDMQAGHGAVVRNVEADSPAAKAGLTPGDVILSVDGQAVDSAEGCVRLLRATDGDNGVRLHVQGRAGARFVLLHPASGR